MVSSLLPPRSFLTSSILCRSRSLSRSYFNLSFETLCDPELELLDDGDFECFIICDKLGEDLLALLEYLLEDDDDEDFDDELLDVL